jgi:hypothetical protein
MKYLILLFPGIPVEKYSIGMEDFVAPGDWIFTNE